MRLSKPQHDALKTAAKNPLRRVHDDKPGKPPWPAASSTLAVLCRLELVTHDQHLNKRGWRVDEWTITDKGHEILNPKAESRELKPVYMARSGAIKYRRLSNNRWAINDTHNGEGDYTSDPSRSIDHERDIGAVAVLVTEKDLEQFAATARAREARRLKKTAAKLDVVPLEERLERVIEIARGRHHDFSNQARLIRYMLKNDRRQHALKRIVRAETLFGQRAA